MESNQIIKIICDTHVHIFDYFDWEQTLDAAFLNFNNAASSINDNLPFIGVLFLTEDYNQNWFVKHSPKGSSGKDISKYKRWNIRSTQEECSIIAERNSYQKVLIIAGRQVNTLESVEVLALATTKQIQSKRPIRETISDIKSEGGIPVLPWGFGKWFGNRGKIIRKILSETKSPSDLFLGDNGGRPSFWRNPTHFKQAEKLGIQILPGSDPLAFSWEYNKPGSFGFCANAKFDQNYPSRDIKKLLSDPETKLYRYGNLENPFRSIINQFLIQIKKSKSLR